MKGVGVGGVNRCERPDREGPVAAHGFGKFKQTGIYLDPVAQQPWGFKVVVHLAASKDCPERPLYDRSPAGQKRL
ncbi:hypothetical protein FJTKL_04255 [Diaporthe vaccinii]|uniref:Uncharacterized protein n=1 Tax=Diaporthe vaccinii TaxID=105482 RepID=A0ABR4F0B5_9PEZI